MDGRKKKFIKELLEKPRARRSSGLFIVDGPKMCAEIPPEQVEEIYVSEGLLASEHAGELSKNKAKAPDEIMKEAKDRVQKLLAAYPLYPELDLDFLETEFPLSDSHEIS